MINKDKINRVMVYDIGGKMLISTSTVSFPKDFFKVKGQDLVMLKGKGFPSLPKDETIDVIFEYATGTRVKYRTHMDICTDRQVNFHVGEGEVLEERRRSFKITVDFNGMSPFYIRGEEMYSFEDPVELQFVNLNLGGVYFKTNAVFQVGDQVMLYFLDGDMQILCEILRAQKNEKGEIDGYGCRFLDVNQTQEERLARFIFDCQVAERDRKLAAERRSK